MDASLLIIGAGPAGLLAACAAARQRPGAVIRVVDRLGIPGVKLAASGGGRGNLSHLATEDEFAHAFGRQGRFTLPAFRSLPPERLRNWLADIGVPTTVEPDGRIYPANGSAADLRQALVQACRHAGVRFTLGHPVHTLRPPEDDTGPWRVDDWTARAVLLAAGGCAAPALGSDGSGFRLAAALEFDLIPPVPALTSIRTVEDWPRSLPGVSLPWARVTLATSTRRESATAEGALLFTHQGLSGPSILNLSGRVSRLLHTGRSVRLNLSFRNTPPNWPRLRRSSGALAVLTWLSESIPRALARVLLNLSGLPENTPFARLTRAQEESLHIHLLAAPLAVQSTGDFAASMVTSGGISLQQVRPDTLESRRHPRLYLAGELLDLDGPTGGWNLHWAFCSGHLAGRHAITH